MKRHPTRLTLVTLALTGAAACAAGSATHTASTGTLSTTGGDRAWLAAVHQANLAEVQVGELAKKKGGTAAIRAAGAILVTDHVASDTQVTRVAKSLKLTLPSSAAPADAAAASRLGDEAGAQFDHDFVSTMMTGHQKLIAETQTEISQGSTPQIKNLAQSTLPVLRKHLAVLQKAAPAG
jgi:predicted outer membrane protein